MYSSVCMRVYVFPSWRLSSDSFIIIMSLMALFACLLLSCPPFLSLCLCPSLLVIKLSEMPAHAHTRCRRSDRTAGVRTTQRRRQSHACLPCIRAADLSASHPFLLLLIRVVFFLPNEISSADQKRGKERRHVCWDARAPSSSSAEREGKKVSGLFMRRANSSAHFLSPSACVCVCVS